MLKDRNIKILLTDYLSYLIIEKNRSPKTRDAYERYIKRFIKHNKIKTIDDITDESVRRFRLELARKNLKKNTQAYHVIAIRNFLKYLTKRGLDVLSPERIELPGINRQDIEVLDYKELERLLEAPKGSDLRALRDRSVLEMLFSTGLRVSEICKLDRYIDVGHGELSVRGKGGKVRVVFLSDRVKGALKKYLDKRSDADEALFISISKSGKILGRITPRSVQRLVAKYGKEAGIPKKVHPHQLRHQFATDLLLNGADLRAVQELLGHANISTTQVYTHLTNKELREIHEAFHGRRRKN